MSVLGRFLQFLWCGESSHMYLLKIIGHYVLISQISPLEAAVNWSLAWWPHCIIMGMSASISNKFHLCNVHLFSHSPMYPKQHIFRLWSKLYILTKSVFIRTFAFSLFFLLYKTFQILLFTLFLSNFPSISVYTLFQYCYRKWNHFKTDYNLVDF